MLLKIKAVWRVILILTALGISSCGLSSGSPEAEQAAGAVPSRPVLTTTMGDLVIASSRLADEVHGQKARSGEKFLLVILTQPNLENLDPGGFSLETFQKMIQENSSQIYVSANDGSQYISTMAGWVQDEFAVGFAVPVGDSFILYWPANPPIDIIPVAQ